MSDTWADGAWVPVLEKGTKRSSSGSLNKPLSWVLSACVASAVQVLGSSSTGFSDVTSVTSLLSSSSLICRTRGFFFLAEDFNCTREAGKVVQQNIQQLKKNPSFFFLKADTILYLYHPPPLFFLLHLHLHHLRDEVSNFHHHPLHIHHHHPLPQLHHQQKDFSTIIWQGFFQPIKYTSN